MSIIPTPEESGKGSWHAEASIPGGGLKFLFDSEPSRDVVVTVAAEPGTTFTVPEIKKLHAALGNILAELD